MSDAKPTEEDGKGAAKASLVPIDDTPAYVEGVHRQVRLARIMSRPIWLTWWLIAVNLVLWLGAKGYGIWLGDLGLGSPYLNAEQLSFWSGMKLNAEIHGGQWWRLISSQFVHLDMLHLLFNGYGIYVLGRFFERAYGWRRMMVLYVLSGTAGGLASLAINPGPAGGASGAVYGLVGGLLVFGFKYRKWLPEKLSKALTVGLLPWVVLSIGIGFIDAIPMDNAAHVGGLLTGGIITVIMTSRLVQKRRRWTQWGLWALVAMVALVWLWTLGEWSAEATRCLAGVDAFESCYPDLVEQLEDAEQGRSS